MTQELVVRTDGLTKRYGGLVAVDRVSFNVRYGEIFAFLGPNGAGKTTAIEMLQCLRTITSGSAHVLGLDVTKRHDQKEIRKRIGVLPQDFNALEKLTVRENIALFASLYDDADDPGELISILDLEEKADVRFENLSGGLRQRVGIAAALVNKPELVFLDEPTTGLDPRSRRDVWEVIRSLKDRGSTVFLTTHYMEEAERLADRIAVIHNGRIVAMGSPTELLEQHGGHGLLVVQNPQPGAVESARKAFPDGRHARGDLQIPVKDIDEMSRVLDALRAIGIRSGIQIRNPTIEDVFLSLVGTRVTEEGELA